MIVLMTIRFVRNAYDYRESFVIIVGIVWQINKSYLLLLCRHWWFHVIGLGLVKEKLQQKIRILILIFKSTAVVNQLINTGTLRQREQLSISISCFVCCARGLTRQQLGPGRWWRVTLCRLIVVKDVKMELMLCAAKVARTKPRGRLIDNH